jgi:hypothetical protein
MPARRTVASAGPEPSADGRRGGRRRGRRLATAGVVTAGVTAVAAAATTNQRVQTFLSGVAAIVGILTGAATLWNRDETTAGRARAAGLAGRRLGRRRPGATTSSPRLRRGRPLRRRRQER